MKKYIIEKDDSGSRLDKWFKRELPEIPHAMLQKLLRKGLIRVNGKKVEANFRINSGDEVLLKVIPNIETQEKRGPTPRTETQNQNLAKDFAKLVIFENNDYIIINKPHGLASQGGRGITVSVDDMIHAVSERYKLVHRLDKDTSGVLAIAKKTTAAAKFSELLKNKKMSKIYWALVKGVPPKQKGTIRLALLKKGERAEKVEVDEENGKSAITEYAILEKLGNKLSWLELSPITGRTHQLRVHCASMDCPIIGDGKYGGADCFEKGLSNKLHLHARRLIVPELGIDITAPLPEHMKEIAPDV